MTYVLNFTDAECRDTNEVGGKAAGLAQMTSDGLTVAPGFAVAADSYRAFLDQPGVRQFLAEVFDPLGPKSGHAAFETAEKKVTEYLETVSIPDEVAAAVRSSYAGLCETTGVDGLAVAVRSSATAEDSVDASFAGEFETWVDISGAEDVLTYIHKCYVSVFASRVLSYLAEREIDPQDIEMAVVVQKTVRARSAGVIFTLSPTTGDRSKVVVEASWGLGLAVVGGEVTPDRFLVDKIGLEILERTPGHKHIEYRRGDEIVEVAEDRIEALCLNDDETVELAKLGKKLEQLNKTPQDIEFAIDEELPEGENLILLQCRPETVWSNAERKPAFDESAGMMSWITGSITGSTAV